MLGRPHGYAEIVKLFGDPSKYMLRDGTLSPRWEAEHIIRVTLPAPIPYGSDPSILIKRVACHVLLREPVTDVFRELYDLNLYDELHTYDGGFVPRMKRTNAEWSGHTFGAALDLNAKTNKQGTIGDMSPRVIAVFEKHRFYWGGRFKPLKARDPMHFQHFTGY